MPRGVEEKAVPSLTSDQPHAAASRLSDPRVVAYVAQSGRSVGLFEEAELETPEAKALWAWWCRATETGVQPHRRDFDVVEHRGLAASLYLVEPMAADTGCAWRARCSSTCSGAAAAMSGCAIQASRWREPSPAISTS